MVLDKNGTGRWHGKNGRHNSGTGNNGTNGDVSKNGAFSILGVWNRKSEG